MQKHSVAAQVDVAEIWQDEQERYEKGLTNNELMDELFNSLAPCYILKGHEPFASNVAVRIGETDDNTISPKAYYDKYDTLYRTLRKGQLDFFKLGGAFYDLNNSCIINYGEVQDHVYLWLSAFKLRQLEQKKDELLWVLGYHFNTTFQKKDSLFQQFLDALQSYNRLFIPETTQLLLDVQSGQISLPPESEYNFQDPERPSREVFKDRMKNPSAFQPGNEPDLGAGSSKNIESQTAENNSRPIANMSDLTEDEIAHYFSILYKERENGEGMLLTKEQVDFMFRDGITIPSDPLVDKYKLALSPRYTKKLTDLIIYRFISIYNPRKKKDLLRFFGSYIQDYAQALNPKGLENLNKNVTGDLPFNLGLNPNAFLPERHKR